MAFRVPTTLMEHLKYFRTYDRLGRMGYMRTYDQYFFKQVAASKLRRKLLEGQSFKYELNQKLGSDITAAHFVTKFCNGSILDQNNEWVSFYHQLPQDYDHTFQVKAIKANKGNLLPEGMDNFTDLKNLELLDLSCNPRLDDFACDQLARHFRTSSKLRTINLSHNPGISIHGIEILFRIPTLTSIIALGTLASTHEQIDMLVLAAEQERRCDIYTQPDGVKYRSNDLEELRVAAI